VGIKWGGKTEHVEVAGSVVKGKNMVAGVRKTCFYKKTENTQKVRSHAAQRYEVSFTKTGIKRRHEAGEEKGGFRRKKVQHRGKGLKEPEGHAKKKEGHTMWLRPGDQRAKEVAGDMTKYVHGGARWVRQEEREEWGTKGKRSHPTGTNARWGVRSA